MTIEEMTVFITIFVALSLSIHVISIIILCYLWGAVRIIKERIEKMAYEEIKKIASETEITKKSRNKK